MALEKNITLESGVNLPNAYIKVSEVIYFNYPFRPSYVEIIATIYKDQISRDSGFVEVTKFTHRCTSPNFDSYFSLDVLNEANKNIIGQAYEWMITMDIYSGATIILDEGE